MNFDTVTILTDTLDALGTVLIGVAALSVHRRVLSDAKISRKVVTAMRLEQFIGVAGICMIIASFLVKIIF